MEIESNIPLPVGYSRNGLKGAGRFPHCLLEPGQSFFVTQPAHLRSIVWKHAKVTGKRFTVRREGDGYRCWRIS
jgi:hypothetical protein